MTEYVMATTYSLSQFKTWIKNHSFDLCPRVAETLSNLASQIVIPPLDEKGDESVPGGQGHGHGRPPSKGKYPVKRRTPDDWAAARLPPVRPERSRPAPPQDRQKDIRVALNKLSAKNFETQRAVILEGVAALLSEGGSIEPIAGLLFDVAGINKMYSEWYAKLYRDFLHAHDGFLEPLHACIQALKGSISVMTYCDPNTAYDGYCLYVKENDKNRAISSFMVMLAHEGVIEIQDVVDMLLHFQNMFMQSIDQDAKTQECEELVELMFNMSQLAVQRTTIVQHPAWHDQLLPTWTRVATMSVKAKEHVSLTSRAVFKHLDLVDALKKLAL